MFWLEMALDEIHGGGEWGFAKTLWSPALNKAKRRGPYWETLLLVKEGDYVLHLRKIEGKSAFVGFSVAASDGFKTTERPPEPGNWDYPDEYYRVNLRDYKAFPTPINLDEVFNRNNKSLREYFMYFKGNKKLFYEIGAKGLKGHEGAYLSQVDTKLANILLGLYTNQYNSSNNPDHITLTGERIRELLVRVGQKEFSQNVRANYSSSCCFPKCIVHESNFLIGSHIDRWSDNPETRGNISNGLCLCLMHDKAFEAGYFILDDDYRVRINWNNKNVFMSEWSQMNLLPYEGQQINLGDVLPSSELLRQHWRRVGYRS